MKVTAITMLRSRHQPLDIFPRQTHLHFLPHLLPDRTPAIHKDGIITEGQNKLVNELKPKHPVFAEIIQRGYQLDVRETLG